MNDSTNGLSDRITTSLAEPPGSAWSVITRLSIAGLSLDGESVTTTVSATDWPLLATESCSGTVSVTVLLFVDALSESGRVSAVERRGIEVLSVITTVSVRVTLKLAAYATKLEKTNSETTDAASAVFFLDQIF